MFCNDGYKEGCKYGKLAKYCNMYIDINSMENEMWYDIWFHQKEKFFLI
jgi:hypothetical protein